MDRFADPLARQPPSASMNLFADLLASTNGVKGGGTPLTQAGPRIQKGRRGVEVKSAREIAIRIGVAPSTVRLTMKRLAGAGLDEAAIAGMNDETLEARLFSRVGTKQGLRRRVEPDFALIHRELKRKHVTLQILWDEYIERHSDLMNPLISRTTHFCR
jgi:hypothetical protein